VGVVWGLIYAKEESWFLKSRFNHDPGRYPHFKQIQVLKGLVSSDEGYFKVKSILQQGDLLGSRWSIVDRI